MNEDLNKTVAPQTPIIFYHSADLDGKCSAAIVLRYEKQCWNRDCELFGINYGDPFPWEKITPSRRVYMVDFSLQPYPEMFKLAMMTRDFHWIDHHKSVLPDTEKHGWPICYRAFEEGKAGCELTWSYLYQDSEAVPMPHAVLLLGRYDVWDEKCTTTPWSHILAFQYGMRLKDNDPRSLDWLTLFGDNGIEAEVEMVKAITVGGHSILAYEATQNEIAMSACGFVTEFEGLRALACNRGPTNSKLFESQWDPEKHDVMLSFYWSRRGEWKLGLYTTKPGIDCGALCKKYGGGGHPKAAGCQCKELPFALGGRIAVDVLFTREGAKP
jgi:hypothetical protein